MVSSLRDRPLLQDLVVFGEVGWARFAGAERQERIRGGSHGFRRATAAANVPKSR